MKTLIFSVAVFLFLPVSVQAACVNEDVVCPPVATDIRGNAVNQQFDLDFQTRNQALVLPGNAGSIYIDYPLLRRDATERLFSSELGRIYEYCLFDWFRDVLDGALYDAFTAIFGNRCYSYNGFFKGKSSAYMEILMGLTLESGVVDVDYPVSLQLTMPATDGFNPGDTIEIQPQLTTRSGINVLALMPTLGVKMKVGGKMSRQTYLKVCVDDCNTVNLADYSVQGHGEADIPRTLQFSNFDPFNGDPEDALLGFLAGSTGYIELPRVTQFTQTYNDLEVLATGQHEFVSLNIDLVVWALRFMKVPGGFVKKTLKKLAAEVALSPFDIITHVGSIVEQRTRFEPSFYLQLDFDRKVSWAEVDASDRVVRTGDGQRAVISPRNWLRIYTAVGDYRPLNIDARVYQENRFQSSFDIINDSWMDFALLKLNIRTPDWNIFDKRCIDYGLGKTCVGPLKWRGDTLVKGPAFSESKVGRLRYSNRLLDLPERELPGFQTFTLQSLRLDPNEPPQTSPIGDQYWHWEETVDLDLGQYFTDPDGHVLQYTVTGLPPFLHFDGSGRISGQVDRRYEGEIRILADDGHGATVAQQFQVKVAMPVVDEGDGLRVSEAGGQDQFSVRLSIPPRQNVVVTVHPQNNEVDLGAGVGAPVTLNFGPADWDQPQTVTVVADDDLVDETGTELRTDFILTSTSSDAAFDAMTAPVFTAVVEDDDVAGIVADPARGAVFVEDGGQFVFNIRLNSQPTANVTFNLINKWTPAYATFTPQQLTFTPQNWNQPQAVTATGVADNVADGSHVFGIEYGSPSSADAVYAALPGSSQPGFSVFIAALVSDNDAAGITLSPDAEVYTEEQGTAVVSVVLNSQPACAQALKIDTDAVAGVSCGVTVGFAVDDASAAQVSPAELTFSDQTWNVPQQVVVSGVDDWLDDGEQSFVLTPSITIIGTETTGYGNLSLSPLAGTTGDDDESGMLVTSLDNDITDENGAFTRYAVRLTAQPVSPITVNGQSLDANEGRVRSALVFDAANWSQPQTLVVEGVDDNLVDGSRKYQVELSATGDANYAALAPMQLLLVNEDNDVPGVQIDPQGVEILAEDGGVLDYGVSLARQPLESVRLYFSSDRPDQATVSPMMLEFTPANWNSAQLLTVSAVDDALNDGDQTVTIVSRPVARDIPGWEGFDPPDRTVTVTDDDSPGLSIAAVGDLMLAEPDGQLGFVLRLNSQPAAAVDIPVSLDDATGLSLSPATVHIEPENWNLPHFITVQVVDDDRAQGSSGHRLITAASQSADSDYNGRNLADFDLQRQDDDQPGILVGPLQGVTVSENGGQGQFQIQLQSEPLAPVTVSLGVDDPGELSLGMAQVNIQPQDWNQPVTVSLQGVDDLFVDGSQMVNVMTRVESADAAYAALDPDDLQVRVEDDDRAGALVDDRPLVVSETGTQASFTVRLAARPQGTVKLAVGTDSPDEGEVLPTTLLFDASNWNQTQQVTVTGVDDNEDDGDQQFRVTVALAADSPDPDFINMGGYSVLVTNRDDQDPAIKVTPIDGLLTDESGTQRRFTVSLDRAPAPGAQVQIALSVDDPGEVQLDVQRLFFSDTDWAPRLVTVTGVDDAQADGDQPWQVLLAPAVSSDTHFAGYDPRDVAGTNRDNDLDSDGDGVSDILEGDADRDGDGPVNRLDYDPTGYFYDSQTGEIVSGGKITVACDRGSVEIVQGRAGASGYYQYKVTGLLENEQARCEQTILPPAGYMLDSSCPDKGVLEVPDGPLPLVLGADEVRDTGMLGSAACIDNPYYSRLRIEPGDAFVFNNNIPVLPAAGDPVPVPAQDDWMLLLMMLSLMGMVAYRIERRR